MSAEHAVARHYSHGELLAAIERALAAAGKTPNEVGSDDLAPLDEFHIGGRAATDHLVDQLGLGADDHVLDIGCGLGGAARHIAERLGARVTGIDLTPEFVEVGNTLCGWLGLAERVSLHQGSALAMPFGDEAFDGAVMLHVGMNIADKPALFAELARVLRPGAALGVYDVMQIGAGELAWPVPWAAGPATSSVGTPDDYRQALTDAGFEVLREAPRRDFAVAFFEEMRAKVEAAGGPPPVGLHVLMRETTQEKVQNMVTNIARGLVAPVELIARRR